MYVKYYHFTMESIFFHTVFEIQCVLYLRHTVIQASHVSSVHLGQVAILLNSTKWHLWQVAIGDVLLTHIPVLDIASGL